MDEIREAHQQTQHAGNRQQRRPTCLMSRGQRNRTDALMEQIQRVGDQAKEHQRGIAQNRGLRAACEKHQSGDTAGDEEVRDRRRAE
jgi:hypothetical protein